MNSPFVLQTLTDVLDTPSCEPDEPLPHFPPITAHHFLAFFFSLARLALLHRLGNERVRFVTGRIRQHIFLGSPAALLFRGFQVLRRRFFFWSYEGHGKGVTADSSHPW